jgi:hypothetical protein
MLRLFGTIAILTVAFGVLVAGSRLSSDAIAMGLGVLFGVAACIPVSLLILAAQRPAHREERPPLPQVEQRPYPPVIVLTGGNARHRLPYAGDERSAARQEWRARLTVEDEE